VLPHILLHEAGHFIGLDHSDVPCSVMQPSGIQPGLCQHDIEAASALYPIP
jgi:predicted Zn-dependent protease